MIYQIIYSSESVTPMQPDDLEDILAHARGRNASWGITGALVYAEGVFLQILEGDRANVQALMVKILRDLRHETVTVLGECEIPSPVFESWQMAYISATPKQIAEWAGLSVAGGVTEPVGNLGQPADRTSQLAQSILSLLAPEHGAQTKAG